MNTPFGTGELTTKEAAAYISERTTSPINEKVLYSLKALQRGPLEEKRGSRLVYRRDALDAFLSEFGSDPLRWLEGWSNEVIRQMRSHGHEDAQLESFVRDLDPGNDGWDIGELTGPSGEPE